MRELAEQWAGVYNDSFSWWMSFSQEGLKNAQQVTGQLAEQATQVSEQVAEQAIGVTDQTARQGLRLAEEAIEQTERAAQKADPNWLPIDNYDELNVSEVSGKLDDLSAEELEKVRDYEKRNKNRETLLGQIERRIKAAS